jgi:hypothetical protein
MKYLPPDDPTAVYPIGSLKKEETETPAPDPAAKALGSKGAAKGASSRPVLDPVEMTDDALNPLATPAPRQRSAHPGPSRSPVVLGLIFGGAGMLLAALLLGTVALFFYATQ